MNTIKKTALKLIRSLENFINKSEYSSDINDEQEVNHNYNTLTARVIDDQTMEEYFTALQYALSEEDVKNIAITGPYGAGKSTVIYSYLKKRHKGNHINVSLASFDMTEIKDKEKNNQQIELSILQQILYKENSDALPDSRLDRILNRNRKHIWRIFITVLCMLIPASLALSIAFIKKTSEIFYIPSEVNTFLSDHYYINLPVILLLIATSIYFIASGASRAGFFDKKIKLSKIAFLSGEVEGSEAEKSSLLNNCLDEIVYFFSKLKDYRVVVFEDLDRLKNPEIFIKLREINKIVNNNLDGNDTLHFIYSVRDDVFSGPESKTKFFDFILPVIPYMDNKNAYSLLNEKMGRFIPEGSQCLRYTSLFIRDMRCLLNISNEYQVIRKKVNAENIPVKQYAMIFYKNTFSHDYSLVDRNIGVLYSFMDSYTRKKLHLEHFRSLEKKEAELEDELKGMIDEIAAFPEDIRREIISRYIPDAVSAHLIFAKVLNNGYSQTFSAFTTATLIENEKEFLDFLQNPNPVVLGQANGIHNHRQEFTVSLRNELQEEYHTRKINTGDDKKRRYAVVRDSLKEARETIRRRNAISLSELVQLIGRERFGILADEYIQNACDHALTGDEQKLALKNEMKYGGTDALYYLISENYIDQDYMRYRSIFQEGGISQGDNDYIREIAQDMTAFDANQNIRIDDVELVIQELKELNLTLRKGAFHFQITQHLLEKNDGLLDEMIATFFGNTNSDIFSLFSSLRSNFIRQDTFTAFIKRALEKNQYLGRMLDILEEEEESNARTEILTEMIASVSSEIPEESVRYRQFVESEGSRLFSKLDERLVSAVMKKITQLDVRFQELFIPLTETEMKCISFVGKHSLYSLTSLNVGIVLFAMLENDNVSVKEGQSLPWSLARQSAPEVLSYFRQNPDPFVMHVFLASSEKGDAVREVLLLSALSDDLKVSIVRDMTFSLNSLVGIPSAAQTEHEGRQINLHDLVYLFDRIEPDWKTLMHYLCESCDADILTGYLTRHADTLAETGPEVVDGDRYDLLYLKVICNESLNQSAYMKIINNVEVNVHHLDESISLNNLYRLIKKKKIELSADNFSLVSKLPAINIERDIDLFVIWFSQYPGEFSNNSDIYTHRGTDKKLTTLVLSRVMYSELFNPHIKNGLATLFEDYYVENPADEIDLPESVKIHLLDVTDSQLLRDALFKSLVASGLRDRKQLQTFSQLISEPGLEKIFTNLTGATFDAIDPARMRTFLDVLSGAGLIKDWEQRDDGPFYAKISRPVFRTES